MLDRHDLIRAATILWGNPTTVHPRHMRFGARGSKKIELEELLWSDFEAGEYGGVVDLVKRAGNIENIGNGADGGAIPYSYRDRNGKIAYQVIRRAGQGPDRFFMRRPDPSREGEWIANMNGVEKVPYRLPELIAANPNEIVFICEGEKDVDNVRALGCIATCNTGGSGKWRTEYNDFLEDADIAVLPDNDEAGKQHALDVRRKLNGAARSVVIVNLPGLKVGEDVSDWIARGGTRAALMGLYKEVRAAGQEFEGPAKGPQAPSPPIPPLESYAQLKSQVFMPLQWIVPEYIPEGVTLLAGKPKIGKSCLALAITMACARAEQVLSQTCKPCDVLYCALEETRRRMQDRTARILGDCEEWPHNAWAIYDLPSRDKGGLERLQHYLKERPTIKLIIIDILQNFTGKRTKGEDAYAADHATMSALLKFAHDNAISIIVIHHVRKQTAEDIFDTVSGTLGLNGGADTIAVLTKAGDDLRFAVRGRDVEQQDKTVDFDYDMGTWEVTGDYEQDDDEGGVLSGTKITILDVLKQAGTAGIKAEEIAKIASLNKSTVRGTLRRMQREHLVTRTKFGYYIQAQGDVAAV
jgi:hypothetical protein